MWQNIQRNVAKYLKKCGKIFKEIWQNILEKWQNILIFNERDHRWQPSPALTKPSLIQLSKRLNILILTLLMIVINFVA